jgi:hypothetical protein
MNFNIEKDFALLEALVNEVEADEPWVYRALEWLSIEWNPILANSLFNYLILKQDGNYFLDDVFELPSERSKMDGELILGSVLGKEEIKFRLKLKDTQKHILATGTSGSGKTYFGKVIAEEAYLNGVGSIKISDPKADEYKELAMKYPDFLMLNWNELKFNPLTPPPNVPKQEWFQTVTGHLSQCFNFWIGSQALMIRLLTNVSQHKQKPTIMHLLEALEMEKPRYKQKDSMIMSTVSSRLELMVNALGDVITTESSMLDQLSKRHFILSTTGLLSELESWLLEICLIWGFFYRVYNPEKRELTLHIYDEAQHRLFSQEKERNLQKISSSMVSMLVDESRSLNIGICSLSQEPSTLIRGILNNSYLKVAFHLGSGREIKTMGEAMGLDREQEDALHYLEMGEAIVRMAGGFMDPFPVKVRKFEPASLMTEDEFWQHQREMKESLYEIAGLDVGENSSRRNRVGGEKEFKEEFDILG